MKQIKQLLEKAEKKAKLLDETEKLLPQENISIHLDKIDDLYNKFAVRNQETIAVNPEIESFLIDSIENQNKLSHLNVNFQIPDLTISENEKKNLCNNLNFYFEKKAEEHLEHNRTVLKKCRWNLVLGLSILALLLILAHICNVYSEQIPFFAVLGEGFSIIGWVALWEPATYILYGWRQDAKTLRIFMQLHHAHFSLQKESAL